VTQRERREVNNGIQSNRSLLPSLYYSRAEKSREEQSKAKQSRAKGEAARAKLNTQQYKKGGGIAYIVDDRFLHQ
jgi:hypothetical protein